MAERSVAQPEGRWSGFARRHRINSGLLFVLPALVVYALYVAWPVVSTIQYSFFDWDGISPDREFIGLDNYVYLLTRDRTFRMSIVNNVLWAVIVVGTLLVLGFLVAYVLSGRLRLRNLYRTAFFLPTTASLVVVAFVWRYIYDAAIGPLNSFLREVGLGDLTRTWLADPQVTIYAVMVVAIWFMFGFFSVVYLAAMSAIPRDLFESAEIDGASAFQRMRHIAYPLTTTTRRTLLILGLIFTVNEFGFVYFLSRGGPFHASEVVAFQIYDLSFALNRTGYASALTVVLLLVSLAITVPQLILLRRKQDD
ncbi:MAG: sugar ABC transporter permease [Chloroflexi bacterium]|nr:sugar ABC transporter permease [Chloroflexota bacterium]